MDYVHYWEVGGGRRQALLPRAPDILGTPLVIAEMFPRNLYIKQVTKLTKVAMLGRTA